MNGGSTRTSVWCAMLRHAETPKGPRGVPNCLTTGSKTARCTAPWVGFCFSHLFSSRTHAAKIIRPHVSSPHPPRQLFSSHLRIHGRFGIDCRPAGDLEVGEAKRRGSR